MMNNPTWEKGDNRYSLVVQVAKRARQLVDGEEPKVDIDSRNRFPSQFKRLGKGRLTIEVQKKDENR